MMNVGLTGGIASGKSTVAKIFEELGIPVYYSDIRAKLIMQDNKMVREQIIELLGANAYQENVLHRKYIAEKIFENEKLRRSLNQIVHPEVYKDYNHWAQQFNQAYIIKESALLMDTLDHQKVDQIVCVFCPLELRLKRLQERDHIGRDEAGRRIAAQRPYNELIERSDYIIINDEAHSLITQVVSIHEELIKFAEEKKN